MIEVEQPEGVSTRKLVLETARHNVITAYTKDTGLGLLRRFPNVDVVVVHTELDDSSFEQTIREFKSIRNAVPVIGISPRDMDGLIICAPPTTRMPFFYSLTNDSKR
jgi:phospholipid N-methyltransferase